MGYLAVKNVHVTCVILSYLFFFVRGVWMMHDSPLLTQSVVKILPHVVDTVLLASAIAMAIMIRQYPFTAPWLTAKLFGLVVYIGLGMMALRRGRTKGARISAWIAAQLVFFYIVAVAVTKRPFIL